MLPDRLLMTADTVGGVWNYSLQLIASLKDFGIEVHLATMGPSPSLSQKQAAEALSNLILHESNYRLEWMEDAWQDLSDAGLWLLDLEKRIAPDLIHLNGYVHGALAWKAPVCVVAHSCVLSWWEAVLGKQAPDSWDGYRKAVRAGLKKADQVVAPSAAMLASIRKHYATLPSAVVIHNGISRGKFEAGEKEAFVFSAGRLWDPAKNIESVVRAAAHLSWPFIIAGEGGAVGETPANVTFLGRVSSEVVGAQMARAAIYFLPVRYEPFGLSILEAARSGCALILGDVEPLRELWGAAAIYVDPEDQVAMRKSLLELMNNEERRMELASLATARSQYFTDQRMTSAYLSIYKKMLSAKEEELKVVPTAKL